jgi:short subunit dehydrogenase-like uncharacterized protein
MSNLTPAERDQKKVLFRTWGEALLPFIGTTVFVVPIWLGVLLPLSLVSLGVKSVLRKKTMKAPINLENVKVIKKASDVTGREYDVVLFGATGFTGRLSALYLAKTYGLKQFRWAIAGRRLDALKAIRDELVAIDPALKDLPIIIADSNDHASIDRMASSTKCVITTSGPFARYGKYLVQSCAAHGTHYCDITGETDFVREMVDTYDDLARESGAFIISSCGNDCVPWDLLLLECAKHFSKQGGDDKIVKFECYIEGSFEPSGGTLETAISIFNERSQVKTRLGFNPMLKNPKNGQKNNLRMTQKHPMFLSYEPRIKKWLGPFVMTGVNASCLKRSNTVNEYTDKLFYREGLVFPNFGAAFVTMMGMIVFATALTIPPLQWLMRKYFLPAPGQGPSERTMDAGFLQLSGYATTNTKKECKALMYFPTDTGYRDTVISYSRIIFSGLLVIFFFFFL